MNTDEQPTQSLQGLVNASLIAFLLALTVLFVAVLPAEYGIDPTGLGLKMGLTALAESNHAQLQNCPPAQQGTAAAGVSPSTATATTATAVADLTSLDENKAITWQDQVSIEIPPKKGLEYKFKMAQGAVLEFAWAAEKGAVLYYDFHGEPEGATDGYFKSYQETKGSAAKGKLTAPFAGVHGWYWENSGDTPIKIQLKSKGAYEVVGLLGG